MADTGGFSIDPSVLADRLATSFGDFFDKIGLVAQNAANAATGIDDDLADLRAIIDDWIEIQKNFKTEVQKLKDFKFNPHWKTRVINVPIAIEQVKDLIDEIFHQVIDRVKDIIQPIEDSVNAAQIVQSTRPVAGVGEPTGFARTLNKAETLAGYIRFGFQESRKAFDAAKELTELFLDITHRIEKLEDVFLQQGNPRKRVTGTSSERVGKLHSGS